MTEWIVYRFTNGLLYCESKRRWDEYKKNHIAGSIDFALIATGLTQEQAKAMVELSRSE